MTQIAILRISDRASRGEYEDLGGPGTEIWLRRIGAGPCSYIRQFVPDGIGSIPDALIALCDGENMGLVLTTGGSGSSPRVLTPEAMPQVITKELPGLGELMRQVSFEKVPTAILSRQTAGIRGRFLIVNLPGKRSSIEVCLQAVFAAVPYCLELTGAGTVMTDPARLQSYRPETPA
jgi:molybdopterin adenylyltransferase